MPAEKVEMPVVAGYPSRASRFQRRVQVCDLHRTDMTQPFILSVLPEMTPESRAKSAAAHVDALMDH